MSNLTLPPTGVTMTSLELVSFINEHRRQQAEVAGQRFPSKGFAKLEHKDFLEKVPAVLGDTSAEFSADLPDSYGRPRRGYIFPKREACLMAMSYSYELQAAVFDRMTALEENQRTPVAAIDTEEGKLLLIQEMAAKQLALIQQAKLIEAERDHAIATKAQIGSKREATAMSTASAAKRETLRLANELGRGWQQATMIAVEKALSCTYGSQGFQPLKAWCKKNGIEAAKVPCPRFGHARAWPAAAWLEVYGVDLKQVFHSDVDRAQFNAGDSQNV